MKHISYLQCAGTANRGAFSAADAFGAVGDSGRINIHGTGMAAGSAGGAAAEIVLQLDNGDFIEGSIQRTQRTEIFAEWSGNHQAEQNNEHEHDDFPCEQTADDTIKGSVREGKKDAGKRAGRTHIFTEKRCQLHRDGQNNDKDQQHSIFQLAEQMVAGKSADLFRKWYFVQ